MSVPPSLSSPLPQAPNDRPSGPGKQVGEKLREGEQPERDQANGLGLHADAGELYPVWHSSAAGERRGGAGSVSGTSSAQTDLQTRCLSLI